MMSPTAGVIHSRVATNGRCSSARSVIGLLARHTTAAVGGAKSLFATVAGVGTAAEGPGGFSEYLSQKALRISFMKILIWR